MLRTRCVLWNRRDTRVSRVLATAKEQRATVGASFLGDFPLCITRSVTGRPSAYLQLQPHRQQQSMSYTHSVMRTSSLHASRAYRPCGARSCIGWVLREMCEAEAGRPGVGDFCPVWLSSISNSRPTRRRAFHAESNGAALMCG